jgi:protein-S-isoprenylcysteine O-methyltransferase Ste14
VPVAPPQHLVVTGLYRYVRNPMYVSVVAVICGQALFFGYWRIIGYGALSCLACRLFVVVYEEPVLQRSLGVAYEAFGVRSALDPTAYAVERTLVEALGRRHAGM